MIIWHIFCLLMFLVILGAAFTAHKKETCPSQKDVKHLTIWGCPTFYAGIAGIIMIWVIGILWNGLWS